MLFLGVYDNTCVLINTSSPMYFMNNNNMVPLRDDNEFKNHTNKLGFTGEDHKNSLPYSHKSEINKFLSIIFSKDLFYLL